MNTIRVMIPQRKTGGRAQSHTYVDLHKHGIMMSAGVHVGTWRLYSGKIITYLDRAPPYFLEDDLDLDLCATEAYEAELARLIVEIE